MTDEEQKAGPGTDELVWMTTHSAAKVYGVSTSRTIRKWINSNKIQGRMISGMWYVGVPREKIDESGVPLEELEESFGETGIDLPEGTVVLRDSGTGPGPVDLGPMTELVADLTRQAIEAKSAAAMYQERANQLEQRLSSTTLALESGQKETDRKIEEMQSAIEKARQEAAEEARRQTDAEWRSKSWWQRLKGE